MNRPKPAWKRIIAALDARGATYTAYPDVAGSFLVKWDEPSYPTPDGGPWRQVFRPGQRIYGSKAMLKAVARRAVERTAS